MKIVIKRDGKLNGKIEVVQLPDGQLVATAPSNLADEEIHQYLKRNSFQIAQKFMQISSKTINEEVRVKDQKGVVDDKTSAYFTLRKCLLFGAEVGITCDNLSQKTVFRNGCLFVPEEIYNDKIRRKKSVNDFLKKYAKEILGKKISGLGSKLSLCPVQIEIKPLKDSTWINCLSASKKIVCIDYRTIQLPENLQNYLILHCFLHFKIESHGDRFWHALSNLVPDCDKCRQQLDNYLFLKEI